MHAGIEGIKSVAVLCEILITGLVSKACLERRKTCVGHFAGRSGLVETGVQSMNPRFENAEFRNHVGLEMVDALRDVRSLSALRHCDLEKAWVRFYGTKPCGDHLNVYGAPIRYHVKLHTMGRDDKFDEHALPGFYVGPSPENPEEKYVWTGTRHISVGGSFVIDESRFLMPINL